MLINKFYNQNIRRYKINNKRYGTILITQNWLISIYKASVFFFFGKVIIVYINKINL